MNLPTPIIDAIKKKAEKHVEKLRMSSASIDKLRDIRANNSYTSGQVDAINDFMREFIEWAFNDDNPFLYSKSTNRYIQMAGNSTSWSYEQLLEMFSKTLNP